MVNTKRTLGFTLLEVLITVAIVGILASIAYPAYTDFITRSNRGEAQRELVRFANLQEQAFVDSRSYSDDMTTLGANKDPFVTENGHYSIDAEINAAGNTFILSAKPVGQQKVDDKQCLTLTINEIGTKGATVDDCWEK